MTEQILSYLSKQTIPVSYTTIREYFSTSVESTLTRNLNKLLKEKKIEKVKQGKNTLYHITQGHQDVLEYLDKPFFQRKHVGYNPEFLASYVPNVSSLLGKHLITLHQAIKDSNKLQTIDYMNNRRGIENMIIDMSYSSSKLEGNTYSYLDTEVLIKYHESANGKTQEETQMILNHKNALLYLIENKQSIDVNKKNFVDLHTLLGKGLIRDNDLGVIRSIPVKIGGSSYEPLDNQHQLRQESELFFSKLAEIQDPFEQSFFILVFIPYFQLFIDINKRTSRLASNIPLIKQGLPILSLLQASERDYIPAILAVYELNDVRLLADLYTNNYLLNMDRYLPPRR